jgi:hypothetical protein
MGRWGDGKGGLAHREGIRKEHRRGEVAKLAPQIRSASEASDAGTFKRRMYGYLRPANSSAVGSRNESEAAC